MINTKDGTVAELLAEIDALKQQVLNLTQEKNDVESLLEMTAEHSDFVVEEAMLDKRHVEDQAEIERHKAISQMVAGMAHEINTPIGIANQGADFITSSLATDSIIELLEEDEDIAEILTDVIDAAKMVEANIIRADKLIKSFKNLSVRQALAEVLETVNLSELIEETLSLYPAQAKNGKLTIEFEDMLTDESTWVGYPGDLTQILLNLINNAQLHAYPENLPGKLRIELTAKLGRYVIAVQDFGYGISEENIKQVFTAFYTTKRGAGGTGLGMSIVHNIITGGLQGSIEINSEVGLGTTITISFPKQLEQKTRET